VTATVPVRIALAGAGGRMGRAIAAAIAADPAFALASALDVAGAPSIGQDLGGVVVGSSLEQALAAADVLVDFTRPEGTVAHAIACANAGVALVAGTTGLDAGQQAALAREARRVPIVWAPNMSVGVVVLADLVERAARVLGPGYDIEIVEMHHKHKVDAPSGTALMLGEAAARGAGLDLAAAGVYARHGTTGERAPRTIGFAALRGGDVVGEHTVVFAGAGERIELVHRATARDNFATGALRAAAFAQARRRERATGLFGIRDVLGL